jgi:hypothetical protein
MLYSNHRQYFTFFSIFKKTGQNRYQKVKGTSNMILKNFIVYFPGAELKWAFVFPKG